MTFTSPFARHKQKIANYIFNQFQDSEVFFTFSMDRTTVSAMGYFNSKLITELTKRSYSLAVSESGFLIFTKIIAGIKVEFTFTQK